MKFLMCKPDYYQVEYEINPWMNISHHVNQPKAFQQWNLLYHTLQECGAQVELIAGVKGWPDMVFTANAGLYYQNQIILSNFRYKERQGESPHFAAWFKNYSFNISHSPVTQNNNEFFEGAGDALLAGNRLFAAYGFRSSKEFYEIHPIFNSGEIVYCKLNNPFYYHLDTCFCPLNDNLAIWYPAAFTEPTQQTIHDCLDLIEVDSQEAKRFACNAVVINNHIILPSECPKLTTKLSAKGFTVHNIDMSEFLKAGGACKCLTLALT